MLAFKHTQTHLHITYPKVSRMPLGKVTFGNVACSCGYMHTIFKLLWQKVWVLAYSQYTAKGVYCIKSMGDWTPTTPGVWVSRLRTARVQKRRLLGRYLKSEAWAIVPACEKWPENKEVNKAQKGTINFWGKRQKNKRKGFKRLCNNTPQSRVAALTTDMCVTKIVVCSSVLTWSWSCWLTCHR